MTDGFDRLKSALADRYTIERELDSDGMTRWLKESEFTNTEEDS